ncbi:hypothetical protein HYPGJ_30392 [Hyphomicrobium sp. GJ21]|nr:hypothetical protein HYPGJ_30392 [Hyphomicrobium sp. GJ21]
MDCGVRVLCNETELHPRAYQKCVLRAYAHTMAIAGNLNMLSPPIAPPGPPHIFRSTVNLVVTTMSST